ncbi:hypothetical protein N7492_003059 [Penicillium capsulatum]|uniref:Glutamine amidotransferase domain-containing protein n=1 Tax=Penicillium capsulatum TaxID=69766 RepID=A0A9W9IIW6_9EURO|nr:hypothetical protein N7492_003059 [Penicillium capsulatum]
MAPHRIHVAVLDTDIPCQSVYARRGLYSSQFRVLLQAATERINQDADYSLQHGPLAVHVTAFDAVGGSLPPLESLRTAPSSTDSPAGTPWGLIDAILITGSTASSYDPLPWIGELQSYIQTVHAKFPLVKIFGSCFGHQLIAQALLSESAGQSPSSTIQIEPSKDGFEVGIQPITLNPSFTAHFPPLARATQQKPFQIQLIHGDVVVPTPGAIAAAPGASPAQCAIQGIYNPGRVLTYQGHFEFDAGVNSELCQEFARRSNWAAPVVASYVAQIQRALVPGKDDDDDSKAAAEAVMLFFAGEDQPGRGGAGMITPPHEAVNA